MGPHMETGNYCPKERELDFEEANDKRLLVTDAHLFSKRHCSAAGKCGRTVRRPLPLAQGWGWWAGQREVWWP